MVPALSQLLPETDLGSPKSLSVECAYSEDVGSEFLESVLQKENFCSDIRFLATNVRLENPVPPMPKLRELCLERCADVLRIREIGKPRRLSKLFIAGKDALYVDWAALRLCDISESLDVPVGLCVPQNLGLRVLRSLTFVPPVDAHYATFLWADNVRHSLGAFDVDFNFLSGS